jgi:hypothetical protein
MTMPRNSKREYTVDGGRFDTLGQAAEEFTRTLGWTMPWNGNLDAFNDFLREGFGTPDEGFVLIWRNSTLSRERLGYGKTIKWLEERVRNCHPTNVPAMQERLAAARRGEGQTLFDTLVEIIRDHEAVELRLE